VRRSNGVKVSKQCFGQNFFGHMSPPTRFCL